MSRRKYVSSKKLTNLVKTVIGASLLYCFVYISMNAFDSPLTRKHTNNNVKQQSVSNKLMTTKSSTKNSSSSDKNTYEAWTEIKNTSTVKLPVFNSSQKDILVPISRGMFHLPKPSYQMGEITQDAEFLLGVPSAKRLNGLYLLQTVSSLLDNHGSNLSFGIVVLLGETNMTWVEEMSKDLWDRFDQDIIDGRLQIIAPPSSYYPDWDSTLESNFGDKMDRVKWRSKQNLDAIYLMLHINSQSPKYYLMLEDDIIASKGYLQSIQEEVNKRISAKNWFYLSFCRLGTIGKLFRTSSLPSYAQFINIYWNKKPLDWLQVEYIAEAYCSFDDSPEKCREIRDSWTPQMKPSLFQHMGEISSLKGKIMKVKDKTFKEK